MRPQNGRLLTVLAVPTYMTLKALSPYILVAATLINVSRCCFCVENRLLSLRETSLHLDVSKNAEHSAFFPRGRLANAVGYAEHRILGNWIGMSSKISTYNLQGHIKKAVQFQTLIMVGEWKYRSS